MIRALRFSLLVILWSLPLSAQQLRIYHIDVEQASATLFVAPSGKTLLVDSGKNGMGGRIKAIMNRAHVSAIDFFVDTHYHEDHYGGIDDLVDLGVSIGEAYDRGDKDLLPLDKRSEITFQDYQAAVGNRAHQLSRGMTLPLDPLMTVTCISSGGVVIGEDPAVSDNDENNLSISLLITMGTFRYFIGGDIQSPTEQKIADRDLVQNVDVYVADHHGSDTSSTVSFLQDLTPHVIIISNGDNAGFHHPRQVTLTAYSQLPGPPLVFQTNKCTKGPPCGNVPDEFIGDPQSSDQDGTIALTADIATQSYTVELDSGVNRTLPFRTLQPPATPVLSTISPASGIQNTIVSVSLTGTDFIAGLTIHPGSGIVASDVTVLSPTTASATFTLAADAAVGGRAVTVSTDGGMSNAVTFTVNAPTLTVIKTGSGSGALTSSPAGIDCGATCSTPVTPGQVFALTATSAAGSVFAGWSGDSDCIDGSVTMTASRNCAARFDLPQSDSTLLRGDYDGDGKTDITVYRPSTGEWFLRLSTQGYGIGSGNWYFQWGVPGDVPLSGDFDGDRKSDIAVYRPSTGEWYIRLSTQGYAITAGNWYFQWGVPGDVPITGDFDGDAKTDITVYRPSTGEWYIRLSTQNYAITAGNWYYQWGVLDDQPLGGDFDGDGKTDIAVYRPSTGEWYIRLSTQNYAITAGNWYYQWGQLDDQPVPGDYDGDGTTDIAVYRPATGEWFLRLSTLNYAIGAGNGFFQWGLPGDLTLKGDFDGDAKADIAVYRPSTGEWFFRLSTSGYTYAQGNWYYQWGITGDLPLRR